LSAVALALAISADRLADRVRSTALSERLAQLTPRERQVAQRVVSGQTNTEIADHMGIGLRTVKLHRHHAMAKLGAPTLADLVRIADEVGL
jgi:FixJ family two-component response regulator